MEKTNKLQKQKIYYFAFDLSIKVLYFSELFSFIFISNLMRKSPYRNMVPFGIVLINCFMFSNWKEIKTNTKSCLTSLFENMFEKKILEHISFLKLFKSRLKLFSLPFAELENMLSRKL